ncbi:hypothetical protein EC991_001726 [Linnemannia zychae]|nr:hypothetical protein EC991_001726 [Linnemannia zychae]
MSTAPSPPPGSTATATGQNNQEQIQEQENPDISMTSVTYPVTRPESQDTISSQQSPAPQPQTEEDEEVRVMKQEEQEDEIQGGLTRDTKDGGVREEGADGSSEMDGVVHEDETGGTDEQRLEQEGHQQSSTLTTRTTKRGKGATVKSKKSELNTYANRNGDDQEEGEEDVEEDADEDRKPISATKTERTGENNEEDEELSLSSDEDDGEDNEDEEGGAGSGQHPNDDEYSNLPEETLCRWKDCGKVLPSLAALVIHLSDEHIGWKKTAYTCEWQGCARRPIAQTTRFALISHMRSHTKHKPYDCPVPECDKSFSRSDAMAKHLKFQHGDVPERFTGRKSRGRYTMKDPAASSTLLHSSSFGAKKRRHPDSSRSETDLPSSSSKHRPSKLRKLGGAGDDFEDDGYFNGDYSGGGDGRSEHRYYHHRSHSDRVILQHLENARRGKGRSGAGDGTEHGSRRKEKRGSHSNNNNGDADDNDEDASGNENEDDDDDSDSDFETENGQTPRQRYGLLKAKYDYIHNEREALEAEYEDQKKKLTRLRVERELLLDALLVSQEEFQNPALQAIEDSE